MVLGCCGFHGDVLTVTKNVETQMKVHFGCIDRYMSQSSLFTRSMNMTTISQ